MPAKKNVNMLEKVSESIANNKGMFVVDYKGLTVKETQELRRTLRENGAEMKVYKNNIVRLALSEAGLPAIDDVLVGTCACVFYANDPVDAAKVVKETAKKLDKLEFLGGIADGKAVTAAEARAIADLPSREELIAKFVGSISNPLSSIVRVCNGPAQGLVTALHGLEDQKNAA